MLKQRAKLVSVAHACVDATVVAGSFMLAHMVRSRLFPESFLKVGPLEGYALPLLVATSSISLFLFSYGLYRSFRTRPFFREALKTLEAVASGGLVLFAANFITKTDPSRSLLLLFLAFSFTAILGERILLKLVSNRLREKGYNYRTVLIIGTGPKARRFASIIHAHRHWGLKLIGFVSADAPETSTEIDGYPVLGTLSDMAEVVQRHVIDEVVMAVPRSRVADLEDTFLLCEEAGIRTRIVVDFFPHLIAKVALEEMDGVPLLIFSTTPSNEFSLAVKRIMDLLIAIALIIVTSPVLLLAALLIKLDSKGPVLFRQQRIGLQGRVFTLLKFRSMRQDAEGKLASLKHLNEMDGPVFKMKDDPRVTRVGRFIRRYSIDELPQLINVLKGDMCIVGPRPPMPGEVAHYERSQKRRLSMKPGLTCLWQVKGRNKIPFKEWIRLDLAYIDNWSLWLDLKILLQTIPQVLLGRGAS